MNSSGAFAFWTRFLQAGALAVAVCFSLGATDAGSRFNDLNHRLMCTCGCAQLLGECNHVGCPNSAGELNELHAGIDAGQKRPGDSGFLCGQIRRGGAGRAYSPWIRRGGLDRSFCGFCARRCWERSC